ncbi:uncharacterized protein C18orf19 homolog B [Chanos chanos]|uniref:Uncharacterized protein C18orf19 homolog B n=1 Tax=Chanos chanos TaxID=29144 RepID=A0A6J2W520_CHACN|nr:uncharacterized protein C18orf19 homolog B-like [Chanos chanos]
MHYVLLQTATRQLALTRSGPLGLKLCKASVCAPLSHAHPFTPRPFSTSYAARATETSHNLSPKPETQDKVPDGQVGTDSKHKTEEGAATQASAEVDPLQDKSIGLYQRFKKTFKQYGKVMIPVHLVTSTVWFGTFYYAAMKGVNVVPFLEYVGLPERFVSGLRDSQSAYALTAYAMYKIATPLRYTATLGGTSVSVQYLRKHGYFSTPPPVTEYLHDKMEETRERLSEKMEETKERFSEKMEETKERFSEKMEETKGLLEGTKERLAEKMEETRDKFSEKLHDTKEKVAFRKKSD